MAARAASDACAPLGFSQLDHIERQTRAPGHFGLGQAEERPSGAQLSGCDGFLVHHDRASAELRVSIMMTRCG
jgi:hypothetical protein